MTVMSGSYFIAVKIPLFGNRYWFPSTFAASLVDGDARYNKGAFTS